MNNPKNAVRNSKSEDFWKLTDSQEKIKFLLGYAILAPSTHNSQPWLFRIEDNSVKIYYDPKAYTIKEADPTQRDLYISFGCLIENLVIAAKYFRVFKDVSYILNSEDNCVAEVSFENLMHQTGADEQLKKDINAIVSRVNVRGLFDKKPIASDILRQLQATNEVANLKLDLIIDSQKIESLAQLTKRGLEIAYSNNHFRKEMSGWINASWQNRLIGIPAYALRLPPFLAAIFPWLVRFFNIGPKVGMLNYLSLKSSPTIAIISSAEDSKASWLEVGRLAQRLIIQSNALGLKTSIFVAAVEMADLYKEVQKIIGHNLRPQFLMCIGYMTTDQQPTPRQTVESRIIN